jgi:hypothetical protein
VRGQRVWRATGFGCVNRRIDTLDPVTGPLPKPVARQTR